MKLLLHNEVVIYSSSYKLKDGDVLTNRSSNFKIELWFKDNRDIWFGNELLNKDGMLIETAVMKELKELFSYKYLNNVTNTNPTIENVTIWIYGFVNSKISDGISLKVRVYRNSKDFDAYCEYGDF